MLISKMGYNHVEVGSNCQDFGLELPYHKLILDGCGSAPHAEVGVKLFAHFFKEYIKESSSITNAMDRVFEIFPRPHELATYALFTILLLTEDEDNFHVSMCGDGVIIKQKYDDTFEYDRFEFEGNAPPYLAYNYIDGAYLTGFKNGVSFQHFDFPKKDFKSVGIATDGLEYVLDSPIKGEFEDLLIKRKEFALRRLINREHRTCKDDITFAI